MMKDERADGYKAPEPEKVTGVKDELPDPYVDERAEQPEFIGEDPLRFTDPAVIAENPEDLVFENVIEDDSCDC